MSTTNTASSVALSELPPGSKVTDCLIFDPKGDRVVSLEEMTDAETGGIRIIVGQTCLVCLPIPREHAPTAPTAPGKAPKTAPDLPNRPPDNRAVLGQAAIKRRQRLPDHIASRTELDFLHLYIIYEFKDSMESMSLVRMDEKDSALLSPEMKTVWGKVDRSNLPKAIYAPVPKYLSKVGTEEMEDQMVIRYNNNETPPGWLSLGTQHGRVICPSLSELKPLVFKVLGKPVLPQPNP